MIVVDLIIKVTLRNIGQIREKLSLLPSSLKHETSFEFISETLCKRTINSYYNYFIRNLLLVYTLSKNLEYILYKRNGDLHFCYNQLYETAA